MTLPVACPPSNSDLPTVPQQRKRRRRTPASGASDDCFACTKRNLKCDRRRPYCSQCLEIGKECSGYKTQLTWGVGVASRGKLRGLSLPVARSAPAQRSPPPSSRPRSTSTISKAKFQDGDEIQIKMESPSTPNGVHAYTNYDFVNMAPHGTAPPMPIPDWNMAISHEFSATPHYQHDSMRQQRQLPQLQRLHTLSITRGDALGLGPHSPVHDAMSAYAESDYSHSPVSQSFPNDDIPYLNSPVPMYNYSTPTSTTSQSPVVGHIGMMVDSRGPTSCPDQYYAQSDMSSSLSSHQTIYEVEDNRQHQQSPVPQNGHVEMFYTDDIMGSQNRQDVDMYSSSTRSSHGFGNGWVTVTDDDVASQAPSEADNYHLNDSMSSSFTSDTSPRISFFMDFYDKVICPSVVVIDSPKNPYREHILSLASSSRSLQHAICALAACNLRMKRKQSLGQEHWRRPSELEQLDHINGGSYTSTQLNQPQQSTIESQTSDSSMQEECRHRSLAVTLLNEQLSDPSKARHDSVLATLFILCHYRMCESGIAQFKTQFAGVKKILGMRESGLETGNWGWMETLFTYFDGIAASINDRETQLRGGFLEMVANPANPNHALENLAGCDSILFKTIAKLGRLNLLAQHRPVLPDYPTTHLPLRPAPPQPRPKLAGQALVDFYNLHAHNFDGNGFASTLDDEAFPLGSTGRSHSPSNDDLNTSFWTEWKACRHSLQSWEFDPSRLVAQLQPTPSPTQLRDFGYISEAFRYSALLYTERLACPNLPSSHLNFQNLVSQVLYYVTSLEKDSGAEKFLLWPLFISGSECVNELQQSIVRTKCKEIMGRSGYLNNLAGLEVLEKLWAESQGGSDVMNERVSGGGAFRWARYMDGVDGEWIMV